MDKRGKAYRLWTAYLKYVSRLNRNLYYWSVKDENAPRGYRDAKNWKELEKLRYGIQTFRRLYQRGECS